MGINYDDRSRKKIKFCGFNIEEDNAEINFDFDLSVILLNDKEKLVDFVFFNNPISVDNSICFELEEKDGFDFCVEINLDFVDNGVKFIYFFFSPYSQGYGCKPNVNFIGCKSRLTIGNTFKNKIVLDEYTFNNVFKDNTSMCLLGLIQNGDHWETKILGNAFRGDLKEIIEFYEKETIDFQN